MASETTDSTKVEAGGERGSPSPEQARRELEEQFNVQRARMKELFLQKEEDLQKIIHEKQQLESEVMGLRDELQQLRILSNNQNSELQNLQLLVSETVEASSVGSEEARRLRTRNLELEQQLAQLRHQLQLAHQQQQEVSLAPATLVRSIARKLGADTEDQPTPRKQQNAEDGELYQSIIQPLEQEIAALKHKLRDTDAQLQHAQKELASRNTAAPGSGDTRPETVAEGIGAGGRGECDMCANYEKQLVAEQAAGEARSQRAARLEQALKMATEELEGVRSIHDETIRSWQSERLSSAQQLEELKGAVGAAKAALDARTKEAEEASTRALELVTTLTVDRMQLQKKLDTLERDNAALIGQYTKKATEMQNEIINLPDNVTELQEHTLQLREQLIECAIGRERALEAEGDLRAQLLQQGALCHQMEAELAQARDKLKEVREEVDRMQTEHAHMQELGDKLRHSNDVTERLLDDKKRLHNELAELRQRVSVLQQELDNSEKVQQDFVRLSQSLQIQLQRIREADTEVRWQHDEDVTECPSCRAHLTTAKKKVHCRHCGRIFCGACVSHEVASGPRGAPARVCAVCRTLLQPHAAPYFSTAPPHSPD